MKIVRELDNLDRRLDRVFHRQPVERREISGVWIEDNKRYYPHPGREFSNAVKKGITRGQLTRKLRESENQGIIILPARTGDDIAGLE